MDMDHDRAAGMRVIGSPAGAAQINDVFVDERRVIYAVDRYTGGLYVVEADF